MSKTTHTRAFWLRNPTPRGRRQVRRSKLLKVGAGWAGIWMSGRSAPRSARPVEGGQESGTLPFGKTERGIPFFSVAMSWGTAQWGPALITSRLVMRLRWILEELVFTHTQLRSPSLSSGLALVTATTAGSNSRPRRSSSGLGRRPRNTAAALMSRGCC